MRLRPIMMAALLLLATSGCLGSGGGGKPGPVPTATSASGDGCGPADSEDRTVRPPGLARAADSDVSGGGNRTLRWDLAAEACPSAGADVGVVLALASSPEGCPEVAWRASVTTGLVESDIPLQGEATREGHAAVRPARTDQGPGAAPVVLSLAATFPDGFPAQDDECLDGAVESATLTLDYRSP